MRKLKPRERDLGAGFVGTIKSAVSLFPPLGQAIATYDAYKRNSHERMVSQLLTGLSNRVDDVERLFRSEYYATDEGRKFAQKVIDAALDVQLAEKQELFINALVNGPTSPDVAEIQKMKYIDMLRDLSLASLMVLADIHKMYEGGVRGPGRPERGSVPFPHVNPSEVVSRLSGQYDPFLVAASITEMRSQGLFESTGEWRKGPSGQYTPGGGFATEMCYTHFDARFVEFIAVPSGKGDDRL